MDAGSKTRPRQIPSTSCRKSPITEKPEGIQAGLDRPAKVLDSAVVVRGSPAWLLWLRAARSAGAQPSIAKVARLGGIAVPLSMAAAPGALTVSVHA
jgi:hypothetical protein